MPTEPAAGGRGSRLRPWLDCGLPLLMLLWGCSSDPQAIPSADATPDPFDAGQPGALDEVGSDGHTGPDPVDGADPVEVADADSPADLRPADLAPFDSGGSDWGTPDGGPPPTDATAGPDCAAPVVWPILTVNRIPETMNGSRPFTNRELRLEPYHLLLPGHGFTLDLIGPPAEIGRLTLEQVTCGDRDLTSVVAPVADGWSGRLPADQRLPPGPVTCIAKLRARCPDAHGAQLTQSLEYRFEVGEMTTELDPFEHEETWLLTYRRDHWTIGSRWAEGELRVEALLEPNQEADFSEALRLVGLASNDTAPGAAELEVEGIRGVSAIFRQRLLDSTLAQLRGFFHQPPDGTWHADSVRIHFVLEGTAGAPDPLTFDPAGRFSMIGIGGGDPTDRNVGRSWLDWNNRQQDDDATEPDLGIFTTTMIALFLGQEVAQLVLAPLAPALGGTPIGESPADVLIFAPGFDLATAPASAAQRGALFELALDLLGRGLAALIAHEIGHSLGLVAYGPPPGGLFGGEIHGEFVAGPFDGAHINTPGFNIMQQGFVLEGSGLELLSAQPFFGELNLAYLRQRVIVDPDYPRELPF